mmetsp:Transcript_15931/g.24110  ORF Transcript_15931/g.24110 Transcript_15931/m.24110 type:complete len:86 (+) Transcript_15931:44-301(+)|eukprot:scaffold877_cov100-Skeletonema_dohrnii-CCMP3373.AAC.2
MQNDVGTCYSVDANRERKVMIVKHSKASEKIQNIGMDYHRKENSSESCSEAAGAISYTQRKYFISLAHSNPVGIRAHTCDEGRES